MKDAAPDYATILRNGSQLWERARRIAKHRDCTMEEAFLRMGINIAEMSPEDQETMRAGIASDAEQTQQ